MSGLRLSGVAGRAPSKINKLGLLSEKPDPESQGITINQLGDGSLDLVVNTVTINSLDPNTNVETDTNRQLVTIIGEVTPYPPGHIHNFLYYYVDDHQILVGEPGLLNSCRSYDNTTNIDILGQTTIDLEVTGLNGRSNSYSETTSTGYAIYAVTDTTGNGLATGYLIIPEGADITTTEEFSVNNDWNKYRRIGFFFNGRFGAGSDILRFSMGGRGNSRSFYYDVNSTRTSVLILAGGTATVWTQVSQGGFLDVPTLTCEGTHRVGIRSAFGSDLAILPSNASSALRGTATGVPDENSAVYTISAGIGLALGQFQDDFLDFGISGSGGSRHVYYINSTSNIQLYLYLASFEFDV